MSATCKKSATAFNTNSMNHFKTSHIRTYSIIPVPVNWVF